MASGMYNAAKLSLMKADMDLDSILVAMLVDSTYVFDEDQENVDDTAGIHDVVDHEIACTNYTGGADYDTTDRVSITQTVTLSGGDGVLDAVDITWPTLGNGANAIIGGVVIYLDVGKNDLNSLLLVFIELPDTLTNGEDFTIQWDSTGILRLVQ